MTKKMVLCDRCKCAIEEEERKPVEYKPSKLVVEIYELMEKKTPEEMTTDFFMMNRFQIFRMWKGPNEVKEYLAGLNLLTPAEVALCDKQQDDCDKFFEIYHPLERNAPWKEFISALDRAGNNDEFFKMFKNYLRGKDY